MKRVVLIILDGWGIGERNDANPIRSTLLENMGRLEKTYPVTSLEASGINIGLPWGESGESEVGHLTIGAGKILYQNFPRISLAINDGSFFQNPVLKKALQHAKENSSAVNLVGLLTKGNSHASLDHLMALLKMADNEGVPVKLHLFADGKDSPPGSVSALLDAVPKEKISSLTGRYYAMDTDENWQLTARAYDAMTGKGPAVPDLEKAVQTFLSRGMSEEFLPPLRTEKAGISENDSVIFFNFREDGCREIAQAFSDPGFSGFSAAKIGNLCVVSMAKFGSDIPIPAAFDPEVVETPLGKVLSEAGKVQLRLSETRKYEHVTSFFNGNRAEPFKNEFRVLIPSLQGTRPEEHPEMMSSAVTDRLIQSMESNAFDFIVVNLANADAMAHTGNYNATVEAIKTIDAQIGRIMKAAGPDTVIMITSDHGNAERMYDPVSGRPETQHDSNPVPLYLIGEEYKGRQFFNSQNLETETAGSLADVAPTILEIMGIPRPSDMSGTSLMASLL
jgi:2,3-bisphosphoglycerate-independent phosphoglycerate mutase